jgi:O-succinylbenzoate synthase
MAKAMIGCALHALFAEKAGVSMARHIGGIRDQIESGVSLGLSTTVAETLQNVKKHVGQGYRRIKLKIEPGQDIDRVEAVRRAFPAISLTVDANAAYTLADSDHLGRLDDFGLDYIEQPLHHEDLADHAELARRISTPICLDESIRSVREADLALRLGACRVINIKVGRVGGYEEAIRIEERCREAGVPVWCGGMLESGVGRAHNVALSTRPGFVKPGDISSASRYFEEDIVEPLLETKDGWMPVPQGPGLGVHVRRDVLARVTRAIEEFR